MGEGRCHMKQQHNITGVSDAHYTPGMVHEFLKGQVSFLYTLRRENLDKRLKFCQKWARDKSVPASSKTRKRKYQKEKL